jgi:hypothetical protein
MCAKHTACPQLAAQKSSINEELPAHDQRSMTAENEAMNTPLHRTERLNRTPSPNGIWDHQIVEDCSAITTNSMF